MERKRDELLEHDADGIREFDNDLPRWWLYGFYFTIAFSVLYLLNYHILPRPLVGKAGMVAEYEAEMEAAALTARNRPAPTLASAAVAALSDDRDIASGRAIFEGEKSLCSSCHRADLGGLVGPNLTDEHWLHGCSVQEVMTSIRQGYPMRGMLPFGSTNPLTDQELLQLTSYVLSKRGSAPPNPKAVDPERDRVCN